MKCHQRSGLYNLVRVHESQGSVSQSWKLISETANRTLFLKSRLSKQNCFLCRKDRRIVTLPVAGDPLERFGSFC